MDIPPKQCDHMTIKRRRNSLRLKGFDYSQPGDYFATICTRHRECIFGRIEGGKVELSEAGEIVDSCWKKIPAHFVNTRVDTYQVMPNHVHGIIEVTEKGCPRQANEIKEGRCRGVQLNAPTGNGLSNVSPGKGTLSVIVRTFKAAVVTELRASGRFPAMSIWQRSFHDHIIRDDIDHFFVNQYIELNPIMWELDADNPQARKMPIEDLKKVLQEEHGLNGPVLERVIEYEACYRNWRDSAIERPITA